MMSSMSFPSKGLTNLLHADSLEMLQWDMQTSKDASNGAFFLPEGYKLVLLVITLCKLM